MKFYSCLQSITEREIVKDDDFSAKWNLENFSPEITLSI